MADATVAATALTGAQSLSALVVCGIMGLIGQGARTVVGLKNAISIRSGKPDHQAIFDAAYLFLSLMIGMIAGILAGLVTGLDQFVTAVTPQKLIAIAVSGYAGADFIENSLSLVIPKKDPQPTPTPTPTPT